MVLIVYDNNQTIHDTMFAHMPIIQGILYGSTQRGARLDQLCSAIGISIADLGDSEYKVPFEKACRTWECCVQQTNDNLLGLHLGEYSTMAVLGLVGNLMQSSPNLLAAFERMTHYIEVATDMIHFGVKQQASEVTLTYQAVPLWISTYPAGARHSVEQAMAGTLNVFSLLTGKRIKPFRTVFSHTCGGDLSEYQRVFGYDVQFNGTSNQLVFAKEVLLTPIVSHDKSLFTFFEQILKEKKTYRRQSLTDQIKHIIRTSAHRQIPSLEAIAAQLHMTSRTLQRKLAEEGISFRSITASVQKEMATELFRIRGNATQVAGMLGYSDPSAFRRAFKKWSNVVDA